MIMGILKLDSLTIAALVVVFGVAMYRINKT